MIIGIDAGGTNVDAVLLGPDGIVDDVKSAKADPSTAIDDVLGQLQQEHDLSGVERVVVATTLVLNAAVEGRLPDCSNLIVPGPGLSPELAFHGEENRVLEGCVDHRGRVTEEVEEVPEPDHEVVAITSKFCTRNPDLEQIVFRELDRSEDRVALGHQTSGRLGFPNRAATTVFNAKGSPVLKEFAGTLNETIQERGVESPVYFMKGDAGMLTESIMSQTPSQTVRSGPAASSLGLLALTEEKQAICVDIGGTTTDITLIENGYPALQEGFEAGELYSMYRAVDSIDLPIGGDTRVDQSGITGNREGNAAAFGGDHPTPTDALHVRGDFTTGDVAAAREALRTIGEPEEVSEQVIEEMINGICRGVRQLADRLGHRPDHLIAGGVLAPVLVASIEERIEWIQEAKAPSFAHVAGAVGCAAARVSLRTHVHIDSAQGVMTVNRVGREEKRHVTKGKTFDADELREIGCEEAKASALHAGGSEDQEAEVQTLRSFNVVQQGRKRGQIANMTSQVVPGLDRWVQS
jgi:N-methylhydantoinase A/oxoprolinase/acetone carboxylase beta subunit